MARCRGGVGAGLVRGMANRFHGAYGARRARAALPASSGTFPPGTVPDRTSTGTGTPRPPPGRGAAPPPPPGSGPARRGDTGPCRGTPTAAASATHRVSGRRVSRRRRYRSSRGRSAPRPCRGAAGRCRGPGSGRGPGCGSLRTRWSGTACGLPRRRPTLCVRRGQDDRGRQAPDVGDQGVALVSREVQPPGRRRGVQGRGGLMVTRDFQPQLVGAGAQDEVLQAGHLGLPAEPARSARPSGDGPAPGLLEAVVWPPCSSSLSASPSIRPVPNSGGALRAVTAIATPLAPSSSRHARTFAILGRDRLQGPALPVGSGTKRRSGLQGPCRETGNGHVARRGPERRDE